MALSRLFRDVGAGIRQKEGDERLKKPRPSKIAEGILQMRKANPHDDSICIASDEAERFARAYRFILRYWRDHTNENRTLGKLCICNFCVAIKTAEGHYLVDFMELNDE